ncbi:hypothetical protein EDB89DRAFT_1274727 [Lactarius sanguifluus]|nr:hypothetical protein EDB89DRAFT_1274727 [Lactarius sanguifluus]
MDHRRSYSPFKILPGPSYTGRTSPRLSPLFIGTLSHRPYLHRSPRTPFKMSRSLAIRSHYPWATCKTPLENAWTVTPVVRLGGGGFYCHVRCSPDSCPRPYPLSTRVRVPLSRLSVISVRVRPAARALLPSSLVVASPRLAASDGIATRLALVSPIHARSPLRPFAIAPALAFANAPDSAPLSSSVIPAWNPSSFELTRTRLRTTRKCPGRTIRSIRYVG